MSKPKKLSDDQLLKPPLKMKISEREKEVFLKVLRETMNVTRAAEAIGRTRSNLYAVRDRDPEFRAEWQAAVDSRLDNIEETVFREAEAGVKPQFALLTLKSRRPETWGDKVQVDVEQHSRIIVNLIPAEQHQQDVIDGELEED